MNDDGTWRSNCAVMYVWCWCGGVVVRCACWWQLVGAGSSHPLPIGLAAPGLRAYCRYFSFHAGLGKMRASLRQPCTVTL